MANRQLFTVDDRLRAIELDPDFTWESLQLRLRSTNRKIRMLLAMNVKPRTKRTARVQRQARATRGRRTRSALTLV
jgi:hypothetical protein